MPQGREADARAFYEGARGLHEGAKPAHLAGRGGCWFEFGAIKVHLGVETDVRPARKAHPAFVVDDLPGLRARLSVLGHSQTTDQPLAGYERVYVDDPFGNRIELMRLLRDTDAAEHHAVDGPP